MKYIIISVLSLFMLGCAKQAPYGKFTQTSKAVDRQLAMESVKQIQRLHPAGSTRLVIAQMITDPFGEALIEGLRDTGYAVQEFQSPSNTIQSDGIPIRYVLDEADDSVYRLKLMIGDHIVTRPYQLEPGHQVVAAGHWAFKEVHYA